MYTNITVLIHIVGESLGKPLVCEAEQWGVKVLDQHVHTLPA